jgi:hypothetical protein
MDGMKVTNVKNKVVAIGDNLFESGVINIAAGTAVKAGTVLKRNEDGKFAPAVDTEGDPGLPADGGGWETEPSPGDIPAAVMPFDIENLGQSAADFGFRAIVSGRVRADMLTINGQAPTAEQNDLLRSYTIIPVKVKDLSQLDNQ